MLTGESLDTSHFKFPEPSVSLRTYCKPENKTPENKIKTIPESRKGRILQLVRMKGVIMETCKELNPYSCRECISRFEKQDKDLEEIRRYYTGKRSEKA